MYNYVCCEEGNFLKQPAIWNSAYCVHAQLYIYIRCTTHRSINFNLTQQTNHKRSKSSWNQKGGHYGF